MQRRLNNNAMVIMLAVVAMTVVAVCVPAHADVLDFIQVTWEADVGANRWDYSWTPSTRIQGGDYMEITGMEDIVGATVENAGSPYSYLGETRWNSTYTDTSVRWTRTNATLQAGNEYAYYSYWSDWGGPGSLQSYYRDGVYQGDVMAATTPEPGTVALFAIGLAGVGLKLRRRKRS